MDHHLLIREFRTISSSSIILNNVMYVQPVAGNVKRVMEERGNVSDLVSICPPVTPERTTLSPSKEGLSHQEEGAPEMEDRTYSESTSKNPSENHQEEQQSAGECPMTFFKDNGFGRMGTYIQEKIKTWCDTLSESLVVDAMKREKLKVRDVKDARMEENQGMIEKHYKWNKRSGGRKPVRTEKLPDWFTSESDDVQESLNEEFEAEKAKLMEELKAFRQRGAGVVM
ncbi:hypothetical protein CN378_12720 [Bacillus sp. AFS015802]|uniref:hypothetical protein n=1 Tax=Bacillus sp. AFS015802 TaxID=2033486 RepID=UPI000BF85987|nr:hypothetical protein [Bacillus sp. AFS015802]PFA66759.1 hypothetical protein CN378_12720 [Bacillus sp. AFS015802]